MTTFYRIDRKTPVQIATDSTGPGDGWDSTGVWDPTDSTSTQGGAFHVESQRYNVPYQPIWDWEAMGFSAFQDFYPPAIFQCPEGQKAFFSTARLSYIAYGDGTNYYPGDSTAAMGGFAEFRFFFHKNGIIDSTSANWCPTRWNTIAPIDPDGGMTVIDVHFESPSPINRPLFAGECMLLKVLPHDGPYNFVACEFQGWTEAWDGTSF